MVVVWWTLTGALRALESISIMQQQSHTPTHSHICGSCSLIDFPLMLEHKREPLHSHYSWTHSTLH